MIRLIMAACVYLLCFSPLLAQSGMPGVSDSRVKTFVYNENDVYTILTHYGYQSNIEFDQKETVKTVSVGDRVAWQIIPAGRRLFIKALEENAHTNMTVVTNKRAYQFDLRASGNQPLHPTEELVYVVRFFYPDNMNMQASPPIFSDQAMMSQTAMPGVSGSASVSMNPNPAAPISGMLASNAPAMNYNYTFAGPEALAPIKIYDDGRATYFRFEDNSLPTEFFVHQPNGQQVPIAPQLSPQGEIIVAAIAPHFTLRRGNDIISVYNENMSQTGQPM